MKLICPPALQSLFTKFPFCVRMKSHNELRAKKEGTQTWHYNFWPWPGHRSDLTRSDYRSLRFVVTEIGTKSELWPVFISVSLGG